MNKTSLSFLSLLASLFFVITVHSGCMNREPAPVCPVPIQVTSTDLRSFGYDGLDMIFVIDNSNSMAEEQEILGTRFFMMVNAIVNIMDESDLVFDLRVAVVTSDLGLQYGGNPGPKEALDRVSGCTAMGDDGAFQSYATGQTVLILDNAIDCEPEGTPCPKVVPCPPPAGSYLETTLYGPNDQLALQAACMAQRGTDGCEIGQPLEASLVALKKNPSFLRDDSLLAVVIVSDKDDCSVKNDGFFSTPQWKNATESGNDVNIACYRSDSNEENHLYEIGRYKSQLEGIKGSEHAVVFTAIVGVPAEHNLCQGRGNEIGPGCLASEEMTIDIQELDEAKRPDGHVLSACVLHEDGTPSSKLVTEAKPGRRYVQIAKEFGERGYVYSICNQDWSPALKELALLAFSTPCSPCYTDPLAWDSVQRVSTCEVIVHFSYPEPGQDCPEPFVTSWLEQNKGRSVRDYHAMVRRDQIYDEAKNFVSETVQCPLAKIPADLSCAQAMEELGSDIASQMGWYYCEDRRESVTCPIKVQLTNAARNATRGWRMSVQCWQPSTLDDVNCQENTVDACWNGLDDDGNGVFDCCQNLPDVARTSEVCGIDPKENYHLADPNCCPMTVSEDYLCEPDISICGGGPGNWPDACLEAARRLGCFLPS